MIIIIGNSIRARMVRYNMDFAHITHHERLLRFDEFMSSARGECSRKPVAKENVSNHTSFMLSLYSACFLFACSALQAERVPVAQRQVDAPPHISCELMVDKQQPYVGERVPFTFRVLYDPRTYTLNNVVPSTSDDVTLEFLKKSQKEQQIVNGVVCSVYELDGVLYPKKIGSLTIEPFKIAIVQRSSGLQGFMGFIMNSSIHMLSNQVVLHVQPLPPTSAQTSGLIGAFSAVSLELERTRFAVGEAIMVKYYVKGVGNAAQCKHPSLQLPDELKWYAAESKQEDDGYCFEYAVQATQEGDILIPAQSCVYFNPYYKKYEQLTTLPVWVHTTPSKHVKVPETLVYESLPEKDSRVNTEQPMNDEAAHSSVSWMRSLYVPDWMFGFLIVIGMLGICVRCVSQWFLTKLSALLVWWRYRRLLSRVRYEVKGMKHRCDIKPVYGAFKDLQAVVDWNHIDKSGNRKKTTLGHDAWDVFWQRMECARFDTDDSHEIPVGFVQEAEQWITYFEMQ